jgi:putative ABC transport system permease protein
VTVEQPWPTIAALVLLAVVAAVVAVLAGVGISRAVLVATARAVVQLIAVGVVIGVVFRTPGLAPLYLTVVIAIATRTSARRLRGAARAVPAAGLAIVAGTAATAAVVFGCRALTLDARTAVPFAVQLIGGSMTAASLAGQRLIDDVAAGWAEVEGWLAIGASPRQAVTERVRRAAARALVPALDQTRNVGLVTLPGAYVGLLLAGASPVQAGRIQLLVLVGLLCAETVAAVTVTWLLAPGLGARRPAAQP